MTEDRLTTTEAAALLVWHLSHGDVLTAQEAAQMLGLSRQGAWSLLCRISRVVPIYENDGYWQVISLQEIE